MKQEALVGEYAKSKETRMKLINAAGEIIAKGGLNTLSIRAVANRAGENVSSIHYHFGNKEGLLIATVTYAMSEWMKYDWKEFVVQREGLFSSDAGKARVIKELVDILFELIFFSSKPWWCSRMHHLTIMDSEQTGDFIFTNVLEPNFTMFFDIYQHIRPDSSEDEARQWAILFMWPFVALTVSGDTVLRLLNKSTYSRDLLDTFKNYILRSTLTNLALPEDKTGGTS